MKTSDPITAEQLMKTQAPGGDAPQRKRLNLKPRDESAASRAEMEKKSSKSVRFREAAVMRCTPNTASLLLMRLRLCTS